jgi:hypothetical protein
MSFGACELRGVGVVWHEGRSPKGDYATRRQPFSDDAATGSGDDDRVDWFSIVVVVMVEAVIGVMLLLVLERRSRRRRGWVHR